jgi:uncharacterized alpha/beta hydrolase family protein
MGIYKGWNREMSALSKNSAVKCRQYYLHKLSTSHYMSKINHHNHLMGNLKTYLYLIDFKDKTALDILTEITYFQEPFNKNIPRRGISLPSEKTFRDQGFF